MAERTRWAQAADLIELAPRSCRMYRRVLGLSLREAGEQIGVPHATLWRWETGDGQMRNSSLVKVLRWLDANRDRVAGVAAEVSADG